MSILIVFLALVPSFAWLFFYLQEDLHPEPKKLLALTFVVGAAFSVPALYLQIASNCVLLFDCEAARQDFAAFSVPFIFLFAFIEEAAKFAAAYFTVRRSPAFNEPVDAMIYMVVASLGFAAAENLGIFNFGRTPGVPFADAFEITTLRFIGATLLHALASAIVGYYWAVSIRDFGMRKPLLTGLALATALHAAFNLLIIHFGTMAYPVLLLVIAGFFIVNDFEKLRRRAV